MVKRNPSVYLLFFLLSLAMLLAPCDAAAAGQSPKKVLLLTSYHQGDRWNDSVVQGVREALGSLGSASLSIENLDMRRHVDPDHTRLTTEYIRAKYRGRPQDLVLVSDDPALNFLLTVRDDLFPTTPVVFCGVNNFTPKRIQGYSNITGVNEALSLETTLELALKLFPRTTRIMAMVSDKEVSARTNLEHYRAVAARMQGRVQFGELLNMTDKDAPDILSNLPKDSLILRLTTLLTSEGGFLSIEDGSRILSAYAPVPVFTVWSFEVGDCALGGYVVSGQNQGRTAGNLAIRILEGQGADQIPVAMKSPNVPMFDYKVMKRFGIKESALPKGSVVLNRQVSMWEQYWAWLLGIALFCGLQSFLILTLFTRGKRLRAANFALRESEERYRSVIENISDVYYRTDVEGRLVMFSPSAMRLLGYGSLDEMLGHTAATFYDDPKEREQLLERLRIEGSVNDYEVMLRRRDGSRLQAATTSSYYRDAAGTVLGVEGIFRDITERKRAEEEKEKLQAQLLQAQKMEAVGQLAGGIAHDFNNILTAIAGYSSMILMRMDRASPFRHHVEQVLKSAERAVELTKGLLAFSRKQVLEAKPIDLCQVLRGIERMLGRLVPEDIDIKTTVADSALVVMADKMQIEQVLMNLVTNAKDAMPMGGALAVEVSSVVMEERFVHAHGSGEPGAYACITVSDTGEGMDEETRERIFDPFFTTKEVGKGTGLGMAIIYGIIQQHDGYISIESEKGRGTTFKIYLPLIVEVIKEEQGVLDAEPPPGGTETVLLAEDDAPVRELHRMMLEETGYTVIEAVDGQDALDKFLEHNEEIDILATDMVMPRMNGKSLYEEIRKVRPDMKVLFMSGYTKEMILERCNMEDEFSVLTKPITQHKLLRKIREILDENRMREEC